MNTIREEFAMAATILDLPRDPTKVFEGTRLLRQVRRTPSVIRNMVQYLQPINVKRESEEVMLLRKLVGMKQPPPQSDLARRFAAAPPPMRVSG